MPVGIMARSGRRVAGVVAALLAAGLAVAAMAGCSVNVGALSNRVSTYTVSGAVRTLVVRTQTGTVDIVGHRSRTVRVTEQISYHSTAPAPTHRNSAGTLTLLSNCPALETCSVSYVVMVPRATAVQVEVNVGTIKLASLSGKVTAHTNVGDIDMTSVSGPLDVTGHAGSVLGQGVSSAKATLSVSTGQISVTFSAAPVAVTATAAIGSVTLRVPGSAAYRVNTTVGVGSTHITVTRSPSAPHAITATTTTGSITIEPAS